MSRPPDARAGEEGSSAGRSITAGLAPFERRLSPRATQSDLWASLETSFTDPHGCDRLERAHGVSLDKKARLRSRAFLNQAREYFTAVGGLSPVAKPLAAYYFMLNLTKAFLTASDPSLTVSHHLRHGMTQAYEPGTNYSFNREAFRIKQAGVFRYLAEKTGMGHCWANNYELTLRELMPYLPDAYMLYADAYARTPRLLPVDDVSVLFHGRTAWLRAEVKPEVLKQHELSAPRLLEQAGVFGAHFKWVHTDRKETVTYESIQPLTFGHRRSEVLPKLSEEFDRCLFATDRSFPGSRRYIVLSKRTQLLSHEAVTFGVMHHLSNVVRYRPADAERILVGQHAWLLTSWVDRAVLRASS